MAEQIFEVAKLIGKGNFRSALQKLQQFDNYPQSAPLTEEIFINALRKKLDPLYIENRNLYLTDFDTSQIDIFDILTRIPLLSYSYSIANQMIAETIIESGMEEISIMDIGIGKGYQMCALIKLLHDSAPELKKITIIGLEPADSINEAKSNILELRESCHFELDFVCIKHSIERLDEGDWLSLRAQFSGKLIVTEAYALHHIGNEKLTDCRNHVLGHLKALCPLLTVMIEPNSDHNEEDFEKRFRNCFAHFDLVFKMIDKLGLPEEATSALKRDFWGREIEDIISKDVDANRFERHESVQSWLRRLETLNFKLNEKFDHVTPVETDIFTFSKNKGYVGIDFEGETLVAVISAGS